MPSKNRKPRHRLHPRVCTEAACARVFVSSHKSPYCPDCRAAREAEQRVDTRTTRVCPQCGTRRPLGDYQLQHQASDRRGASQYGELCPDCAPWDVYAFRVDAPYEVARRQIERIFGIPARFWINKDSHVLNRLHYARMVAINNLQHAQGVEGRVHITKRVNLSAVQLWPEIVAAGLTRRGQTERRLKATLLAGSLARQEVAA